METTTEKRPMRRKKTATVPVLPINSLAKRELDGLTASIRCTRRQLEQAQKDAAAALWRDSVEVGKLLRATREAHGLSLDRVSRHGTFDASSLAAWETGRRLIGREETVAEIVEAIRAAAKAKANGRAW